MRFIAVEPCPRCNHYHEIDKIEQCPNCNCVLTFHRDVIGSYQQDQFIQRKLSGVVAMKAKGYYD